MGKIAEENAEIFKYLDDQMGDFPNKREEWRRKYAGKLYTTEQENNIKAKGLEIVGIPMYRPIIRTIVSMLHSNNPTVTAIPEGDSSDADAFLWQAVFNHFTNLIRWVDQYYLVLQDQFIGGIGFAQVDFSKENMWGTTVKRINPARVRWDINYSDLLMDDCNMIAYYDIMTAKDAIVMTGKKFDRKLLDETDIFKFSSAYENIALFQRDATGQRDENRRVAYIQVDRKDYRDYERLLFFGEDNDTVEESHLVPKKKKEEWLDVKYDRDYGDLTNAYSYFYKYSKSGDYAKKQAERLASGNGKIESLSLKRVVRQISIGGLDLGEVIIPSEQYPIVPFTNEFVENGLPQGEIEFIDPLVQSLQNAFLTMLMNGRLQSASGWTVPEGSVPDIAQFVAQARTPGGIKITTPKTLGDATVVEPKQDQIQSLPTFWGDVVQMIIRIIEYSSSVDPAVQGVSNRSPETFSTANLMTQQSTAKLQPIALRNQSSIERVFEVARDFIMDNSKYDQVARYLEKNDEIVELMTADSIEHVNRNTIGVRRDNMTSFNVEIPINYRQDVPEIVQTENGPETKIRQIIINNLRNRESKVGVKIITSPMYETIQEQWKAVMLMVIQQAPQFASVLLYEILEMGNFPQAKRIRAQIDEVQRLTNELAQKDEIIKRLNIESLSYMDSLLRSRTAEKVAEITRQFAVKIAKIEADIEAQMKQPQVDLAAMKETVSGHLAEVEQYLNEQSGALVTNDRGVEDVTAK